MTLGRKYAKLLTELFGESMSQSSPKYSNYRKILKCIKFNGSSKEVLQLKSLFLLLCATPAGRTIIQKVLNTNNKTIELSFNKKLTNSGYFHFESHAIEITHIATDIPEMTKEQKLKSQIMMARILAHELQHVATSSVSEQMLASANNLKDYSFACRLSEANAYMWEQIFYEEILFKKRPRILYLYHHPNDAPGYLRSAPDENNPDFQKYNGAIIYTYKFRDTPEFRKQFVKNALSGKNSLVDLSVNEEIKHFSPDTPPGPSPDAFYNMIPYFLDDMQINTSVDEVLHMADIQRPKHSKFMQIMKNLIHIR